MTEAGPAGERRLGTVHHRVKVVTFAGLTKRQLGSVARTAAMISAVVGAVSALDRMGIVDILPELPP